jgi:hypothetical protein
MSKKRLRRSLSDLARLASSEIGSRGYRGLTSEATAKDNKEGRQSCLQGHCMIRRPAPRVQSTKDLGKVVILRSSENQMTSWLVRS